MMYCDNPRIKSIDTQNVIGCCWRVFGATNRWGNFPSYDEVFAGDYQNKPIKNEKEESFFDSLPPIKRKVM